MLRLLRYLGSTLMAVACLLAGETSACAEPAGGLSNRVIVGYQGWFGCPNDFEGNRNWQHWFVTGVQPQFFTVDLLPSVREFKPQDLCDTGLPRADGKGTIKLFSSQNPNIVAAHFRWMRAHDIDGAALQRFVSGLSDPIKKRRFDHVLENVRMAAEATGRVFFIVYDISGANPTTVADDVRQDWRYLVDVLHVTSSGAYLRDHGKPVLELWGFGLGDRPGTPAEVGALIKDLELGTQGLAAATVVGGVPTYWRTLTKDSKPEQEWAAVYRSYDVLSPWPLGRFSENDAGIAQFVKETVEPDVVEAHRLSIRYMPVVYPGFSWFNLMTNRGKADHAELNRVPRSCGRFMWSQVSSLLASRVDSLYIAMFDEADESTAIFPAETVADRLPKGSHMLFLNQDGCSLPDDWYLRVAGAAAGFVHKSKLPPRRLDAVIRP